MLARPTLFDFMPPLTQTFFAVLIGWCVVWGQPVYADNSATPQIVIIFDDLGYRASDKGVFQLPTQVAISVLPDTPFGRKWSLKAHAEGRDVMLHLPMEAKSENRLGPLAITSDMYPYSIEESLEQALKTVPYAIGVNNHMGSKLTAEPQPMRALMSALKKRQLLFVDSRTTPLSVAETVAKEKGLTVGRRHIFLDHIQTEAFITRQFQRLKMMAKKRGKALAIAHPHPLTITVIKQQLSELDSEQIRLVGVSDYFGLKSGVSGFVGEVAD